MGNVSDKFCRKNQNTHFTLTPPPPPPENRTVYEIMWKNVVRVRQHTNDNIARRMRYACWITEAPDTHVEYVIFIAFPRQQR